MSELTNNNKHLFGGNREKVIQRDGEKCIKCGMTREEHREKWDRDITVDHIDGKGKSSKVKDKNNKMSNLQTLCLSCHGKKDIRKMPVVQLTLDGKFVKRWKSMSEASREGGFLNCKIGKVISGERNTTGGFKWVSESEYKKDPTKVSKLFVKHKSYFNRFKN